MKDGGYAPSLRSPLTSGWERRVVWGALLALAGSSAGFLLGLGLAFPILRLDDDKTSLDGLVYSVLVTAGLMVLGTCVAMWWTGARNFLLLLPVLVSGTLVGLGLVANTSGEALIGLLLMSLLAAGALVALFAPPRE